MKKYSAALIITAIVLALALIYLVSEFKPINSLMKPPKVEGENLAIQLAFEESVGENKYLLKQPLRGEHRSAYTFIDLDGDNDDEVIVFYSSDVAIDIVRMNVLDVIDGKWRSVADFESLHNQIQEIKFADLNGDKLKEIIVGWTTYQDDYSKLLSVYKIARSDDGVSIKPVFDDPYSQFEIMDIDSDGKKDILLLKYFAAANTPETEYRATFLSYTEKGIKEVSTIALDRSIASVTSVSSDYSEETALRRIYIDGYKIDSGMATDCFYWDDATEHFERMTINGVNLSALSSRASGVICSDINSDGIIEIPTEEFLPASNVITAERNIGNAQALIKWVSIDNSQLKTIEYRIMNSSSGYAVKFDESWLGKVTVINDIADGVLTFCKLEYLNGQAVCGEEYFAIKTVAGDNSLSFFSTDYNYLFNVKGQYHYCRIYESGENFGLTYKTIKKSMITG